MTAKLVGIGIDIGTGSTRAVLIDERGRDLVSAAANHAPMSSPKIGWAEQHPHDWWRADVSPFKIAWINRVRPPMRLAP
jgi:sugar (pentulose or hexulose) kinase